MCDKSTLISATTEITLKGPGGKDVEVFYRDWWPPEVDYPCLYVGKSTNIKSRFRRHILRSKNARLHEVGLTTHKAQPYNSSCQLRHIFPRETNPLEIIKQKVGFSCRTDFGDNAIAERFFEEDRLVGFLRPWFNIDSER